VSVKTFTPSLLDRLFDDASSSPVDSLHRGLGLEQMKDCVARDLEDLLNSRVGMKAEVVEGFRLAKWSILTYGIRDFAGMSLGNTNDQAEICRSIGDAIERHEPRLRDVDVSLKKNDAQLQSLLFSVTALLVLDPAVEAVSFDAFLQPTTQRYSVSLSRRIAGKAT
jgi:type VI secretion system protein ImpF